MWQVLCKCIVSRLFVLFLYKYVSKVILYNILQILHKIFTLLLLDVANNCEHLNLFAYVNIFAFNTVYTE